MFPTCSNRDFAGRNALSAADLTNTDHPVCPEPPAGGPANGQPPRDLQPPPAHQRAEGPSRGATPPRSTALLAGLVRRDHLPPVRARSHHRVAHLPRARRSWRARVAAAARAAPSCRRSASRVRLGVGRARDPRLRCAHPRGPEVLQVAAIARELRFEAADLPPQLAPCAELVCLQPDRRARAPTPAPRRSSSAASSPARPARPAGPARGLQAAPQRRAWRSRRRARVDARLDRGLDRLRRDPLDLGRAAGVIRDEAAAAVPRDDQALVLEPRVDPAYGVER